MGTLQIWDSKICVIYTKRIAKEKRQQQTNIENQLKILEKSLDEDDNLSKYNAMKNELDASYDHTREGIRIRSNMAGMNIAKNQQKIWI